MRLTERGPNCQQYHCYHNKSPQSSRHLRYVSTVGPLQYPLYEPPRGPLNRVVYNNVSHTIVPLCVRSGGKPIMHGLFQNSTMHVRKMNIVHLANLGVLHIVWAVYMQCACKHLSHSCSSQTTNATCARGVHLCRNGVSACLMPHGCQLHFHQIQVSLATAGPDSLYTSCPNKLNNQFHATASNMTDGPETLSHYS